MFIFSGSPPSNFLEEEGRVPILLLPRFHQKRGWGPPAPRGTPFLHLLHQEGTLIWELAAGARLASGAARTDVNDRGPNPTSTHAGGQDDARSKQLSQINIISLSLSISLSLYIYIYIYLFI